MYYFLNLFLDCDCQTINIVLYNDVHTHQVGYQGIYQKMVDVYGRTA